MRWLWSVLTFINSCIVRDFDCQMDNFDVEHLRQVLEHETELLNRGSADEVICATNSSCCSYELHLFVSCHEIFIF